VKNDKKNYIDIEIDKLTNSIENIATGESFDTEIVRLTAKNIKLIIKADWRFDWRREIKDETREVYKLSTVENKSIVHGLISIEDKGDLIFLHLVESAKFNKGKSKTYAGVPGNLVAYACKLSFEKGYDGYVAFDSKSALIDHYKKTLGAIQIGRQRMYIHDVGAKTLISKYFKQ
jgi:hypothetical protein